MHSKIWVAMLLLRLWLLSCFAYFSMHVHYFYTAINPDACFLVVADVNPALSPLFHLARGEAKVWSELVSPKLCFRPRPFETSASTSPLSYASSSSLLPMVALVHYKSDTCGVMSALIK